jgi:hypothetical protein
MQNRPSFEDWMRQVDRVLAATTSLSRLDRDDCPYRDRYEDHVAATVAAARAKRRSGGRNGPPPLSAAAEHAAQMACHGLRQRRLIHRA